MEILKKLESRDGSIKMLLRLCDGNTVEALHMNDKSNMLTYNCTVCISSQVGCKIGCLFCATGKQGFVRNLTESEITAQVGLCSSHEKPLKAVVFAGMGEPLHNYENVRKAILGIQEKYDIYDFEIATAGVVPVINRMIEDFKDLPLTIRLNLSLHASKDEVRKRLIPYNSVYGVSSILSAAEKYAKAFNQKIRVRYMLLKGINDTGDDAARLIRLLENKPMKLILSSYNDNNINGLVSPESDEVYAFYKLVEGRIDSDIFKSFGNDIRGGCGQLRQSEVLEPVL